MTKGKLPNIINKTLINSIFIELKLSKDTSEIVVINGDVPVIPIVNIKLYWLLLNWIAGVYFTVAGAQFTIAIRKSINLIKVDGFCMQLL